MPWRGAIAGVIALLVVAASSLTPICDLICAGGGAPHHARSQGGTAPADAAEAAGVHLHHDPHHFGTEHFSAHPLSTEDEPSHSGAVLCAPETAAGCGPQLHAVFQNRPSESASGPLPAMQARTLPLAAAEASEVRPPGPGIPEPPGAAASASLPLRI